MKDASSERSSFVKSVLEKIMRIMKVDVLDKETTMTVERMVVLRLSTKHMNMWTRLLETKRNEIRELTELLKIDGIKKEIEKERSLVKWGKRTNNLLAKKTKKMIYEQIDNMVWNGSEKEIGEWCKRNKVLTKSQKRSKRSGRETQTTTRKPSG